MKEEDLFKGEIVLARKSNCDKRSRCKILLVGIKVVTVQGNGSKFVARKSDLRPAKITRNALMELGFKEEKIYCSLNRARTSLDGRPYCIQYKYAGQGDISIVLKGECRFRDHNMKFGRYGMSEISYIHEVQRVINKINNQK